MKFISIIVPNFNNATYLDDCLSPFLELSKELQEQIQVIVVDDKSTDNSISVIEKYVKKNPDMYQLVAKATNSHHGGAINEGLKHATGTWCSFLDADDFYTPSEYPKALQALKETKGDIVQFKANISFDKQLSKTQALDIRTGHRFYELFNRVVIMGTIFKRSLVADMQLPTNIPYDDIYSDSYIWQQSKLGIDVRFDITYFNYRMCRMGQSVEELIGTYQPSYVDILQKHLVIYYHCLKEISQNFYRKGFTTDFINGYLYRLGATSDDFASSEKLAAFLTSHLPKIKGKEYVDYEYLAKAMIGTHEQLTPLDWNKASSKVINWDKDVKQEIIANLQKKYY